MKPREYYFSEISKLDRDINEIITQPCTEDNKNTFLNLRDKRDKLVNEFIELGRRDYETQEH